MLSQILAASQKQLNHRRRSHFQLLRAGVKVHNVSGTQPNDCARESQESRFDPGTFKSCFVLVFFPQHGKVSLLLPGVVGGEKKKKRGGSQSLFCSLSCRGCKGWHIVGGTEATSGSLLFFCFLPWGFFCTTLPLFASFASCINELLFLRQRRAHSDASLAPPLPGDK